MDRSSTPTLRITASGHRILALVLALFLLALPGGHAALRTWDGGGNDDLWSNPTNWLGDQAPLPGDQLEFPAVASRFSPRNDFPTGTVFALVRFCGSGYHVDGNPLRITNEIVACASSGTNVYALETQLGAQVTVRNDGPGILSLIGGINATGAVLKTTGTGEVIFAGPLAGGLSVQQEGLGRTTLATNNTYLGATVVQAGRLRLLANQALGEPDGDSLVIASGAAVELSDGIVLNKSIISLSGTIHGIAHTNTVEGIILFASSNAIVRVDADAELRFSNILTGDGSLIKDGAGRMRMTGAVDNDYSGSTWVREGELVLSRFLPGPPAQTFQSVPNDLTIGDPDTGASPSVVRLMASSQIFDGTTVTVNPTGLLDLNNNVETISGLVLSAGTVSSGVGVLTLRGDVRTIPAPASALIQGAVVVTAGATRTFIIADGPAPNDLIISARIDSSMGTGLTKQGAGHLLLTADNRYVGATRIQQGSVEINGTQTTSEINLQGGIFSGRGSVGMIAGTSGRIDPGSVIGLLRSRAVTLAGGMIFRCELAGTNAATEHDQIRVTGTVNLSGSALEILPMYEAAEDDSFIIIDNDGVEAVTNTFAGLPEGGFVSVSGATFRITYQGGSGNDVVLVRRPVPPMWRSIARDTAGGPLVIRGTGVPLQSYAIEASTNLSAWSEIAVRPADGAGTFEFIDNAAGEFLHRFYRFRLSQ